MSRQSLLKPKLSMRKAELGLSNVLGPQPQFSSFQTEPFSTLSSTHQDWISSEEPRFYPVKKVTVKRSAKKSGSQHSRLCISLVSPVVSFREFFPSDLPQREPLLHGQLLVKTPFRLASKVIKKKETNLVKIGHISTAEQAAVVSKEFPGRKVRRKPAMIGHLPYITRKRLALAVDSALRLH